MMLGPSKTYRDYTLLKDGIKDARYEGTEEHAVLRQLGRRVAALQKEQQFFRDWCDRADALYYADHFTTGGADLWWEDESAKIKGRAHVSVNTPPVYVDIPAALQSVEPIENMLAIDNTEESRQNAADQERLYQSWKNDQDFELLFGKAAIVKALYGRTAGRVVWDDTGGGRPAVEVIDQPRNLYLGYKTDNYDQLEWAAYVLRYDPNALIEEFGVEVIEQRAEDGNLTPYVVDPAIATATGEATSSRHWLDWHGAKVEVWDYWYRKPKWENGKVTGMVTCNAVFAGSQCLRSNEYPEYKGSLPYVPLFNTYIPGVPSGRSELHDIEPLIREKYERITAGAQMIANAVAGDYWQLVGPDAPIRVPANLKPKRNELVGPGPGNRIEVITPFIAQFQLEQYLGRLDRESATVSGLNDLLLGLAPAQVLSSSKAINALIANYESRLSMRRKLFYQWRRKMWEKALELWGEKSDRVKNIIADGRAFLEIVDPSLNPRDEMETATRAINLVNAKLMSQVRAMDLIGIDDPETEQDLIRAESTDATMFPERVQVMAQLMGALQSLGLNAPAGAQAQAEGQVANGNADLATALGQNATPDNSASSQLPGDQGIPPAIPGAPEAGAPQAPFAAAQEPAVLQGMLQNGEAKGRIMTQQKLGRR